MLLRQIHTDAQHLKILRWLINLLKFERQLFPIFNDVLERNYCILLQTETAATGTGSSSCALQQKNPKPKETKPKPKVP